MRNFQINKFLLIVLMLFLFKVGNVAAQKKVKTKVKTDQKQPIQNKEPEFPGGDEAIESYFEKALTSVEIPHLQNLTVNLLIGSDGKIKSAELVEGFKSKHVSEETKHIKPEAIDKAVLNAAQTMPAWKPAIQDQKPIEKQVAIPILVYPAKEKDFIKDGQKYVYQFVEENPQYPGGETAFTEYIKSNIKYPAGSKTAEGLIVVRFIVNRFGKIKEPVILKGFHPELEKEVLRVINTSPRWQAGRNNGYPIDMNYNFPVKFEPIK